MLVAKNHFPPKTSPQEALSLLKEGNYRFVNNLKVNRSLQEQVAETQFEQHPFAALVSCMDSHVAPELLFDLGLGDIYSIRLAGNVISEEVVDSLEYAVVHGASLLVVLGHTNCRAIRYACEDGTSPVNLLAQRLRPSIRAAREIKPMMTGWEFVNAVACSHVKLSVQTLVEKSPLIKRQLLSGNLQLWAAMYDVSTGAVEFIEHDMQLQLLRSPVAEGSVSLTTEVLVK